jgi:hypothetical protein
MIQGGDMLFKRKVLPEIMEYIDDKESLGLQSARQGKLVISSSPGKYKKKNLFS